MREFQAWLQHWDEVRGWDRVSAAHTLVHAMEELGEVGRLVLAWEGYKPAPEGDSLRVDLAQELSDVLVLLIKLASQVGVDVESALAQAQVKMEGRHADLAKAQDELAAYHHRQAEIVAGYTEHD